MYTQHFGLSAEPFSLTPDPEFLYLSTGHAEALAALKVGLLGRRGLMVMSGEVGTGKTTLLYSLLRSLGENVRSAYVSNTTVDFDGLLRMALDDFGVKAASPARVDMLTALNELLVDCAERDVTAALIVDEAQNLSLAAFEQLRLLSNFETFTHKLLQIVLVGQPELEARLRDPALRALAERVAVHCRLEPLGERESRAYVDYRLLRAGGSTRLFEHSARNLLLNAANGLPRRINILCHNALLFAYGRGSTRVTRSVAEIAVQRHGALLNEPAPVEAVSATTTVRPPQRMRRLALAIGAAALVAALGAAALGLSSLRGAGRDGGDNADQSVSEPAVAPVAAAVAPVVPAVVEPAAPARVVEVAPVPVAPAVPAAQEPAPAQEVRVDQPIAAAAAMAAEEEKMPEPQVAESDLGAVHTRTVTVAAGSTLESLVRSVYGDVDPTILRRVLAENPQVTNPNYIIAGDQLRFPELEPGQPAAREDERP